MSNLSGSKMLKSKGNPHGQDRAELIWSIYHSRSIEAHGKPKTSATMLPISTQSSMDPSMVLRGLKLSVSATKYLNPGQIPLLAVDQPIYALAKKIQWRHPAT